MIVTAHIDVTNDGVNYMVTYTLTANGHNFRGAATGGDLSRTLADACDRAGATFSYYRESRFGSQVTSS